MAKINIDENPDLAQALRVQSIPTVFVFFQGRPVTAFTGLKSASELKALMDQLSKMGQQARPDAINIPETLHTAQTALNDGQIKVAQGLFMQILEQDENNAPAYAGLVRSFILIGDLDQAAAMLDDVPQTMGQHAEITAARSALELARQADSAKGDLKKYERLAAEQPENKQAQFDHAMALFAAGQQERAIDILIALIAADRNNSEKWEGDKARLQLLKFFEALGPSHPLAISGRRKLSSLLFS
jgi:putative thioredoxin